MSMLRARNIRGADDFSPIIDPVRCAIVSAERTQILHAVFLGAPQKCMGNLIAVERGNTDHLAARVQALSEAKCSAQDFPNPS